ncbi:MAG TPA: signal peptidase II [bacterium]|nr:signal peptidase II [bacterium]
MVYNCSYPLSSVFSFNVFAGFLGVLSVSFLFLFYKSGVWKISSTISIVGVCFLFVGGGYNLVNRLMHGCVADPFPFFGIFSYNLADVFITLGLFILLGLYIMPLVIKKKKEII